MCVCVCGGGRVRPGWQGQGEADNTELQGPASASARTLTPCMFPVLQLWIRPSLKSILKTLLLKNEGQKESMRNKSGGGWGDSSGQRGSEGPSFSPRRHHYSADMKVGFGGGHSREKGWLACAENQRKNMLWE